MDNVFVAFRIPGQKLTLIKLEQLESTPGSPALLLGEPVVSVSLVL